MNLALSEDQRMIRDAAASFLADASGSAVVRAAAESDSGFDATLWDGIVELGWCGVAIPEAFCGMGLGATELVLILEQMGRHLVPSPFFASVALAGNLLVHAGSAAAKKKYLPEVASGRLRATAVLDAPQLKAKKGKGGWLLNGKVAAVVDGATAELVLLSGKPGLFVVTAGARGLKVNALKTWDGTRRVADLELRNVVAERIDDAAKKAGLARARTLAQLCLAAEQLGGAQQCLDLTLKYITDRKQFGRAIASFQALKHRCAQMMVRVEGLRSLVYGAAASQDALECAGAKALASDTFFHCAGEAIQMHGGVGFTWEFDPQLYFKRAQATSHVLGAPEHLRETIAEGLL